MLVTKTETQLEILLHKATKKTDGGKMVKKNQTRGVHISFDIKFHLRGNAEVNLEIFRGKNEDF